MLVVLKLLRFLVEDLLPLFFEILEHRSCVINESKDLIHHISGLVFDLVTLEW